MTSPEGIEIRAMDASHGAAALAVLTRAIRATEGAQYTTSQVEAWLSGMGVTRLSAHLEECVALGAFDGQDLLGFATYVSATEALEFLYVNPAAWRRGVARRLVAAIEGHARRLGATRVRVDASLLARSALERMGYAVIEAYQKHARGESFDNAWLSKAL